MTALRKHAASLAAHAVETARRAEENPDDWLLGIVAENQRDAALQVERDAAAEDAAEAGVLEWRLNGARLRGGEVPLTLLARLADPLNKMLTRAAFFASNHEEPPHGVPDAWARALDLRLAEIAPGSARLMIRGNPWPDTTGKSALEDAIGNVFNALAFTADFSQFYERLSDIGEGASTALRDTLRAIETEECSLDLVWHKPSEYRRWRASTLEVTQVRALLDGTAEPRYRDSMVSGTVHLLALSGRIQLLTDTGRRITIRFNPKTQAGEVAGLTLGQVIQLPVRERIVVDPLSAEEVSRYRLLDQRAGLELPKVS